MKFLIFLSTTLLCLLCSCVQAADKHDDNAVSAAKALKEVQLLSNDIQKLKLEVVTLNTELIQLEEDLLYPSSTKYTVFVSMAGGKLFSLESMKLKIDGKIVTAQIFDTDDRDALARGGVYKLFTSNLSDGEHTATVFFTGLGPNATPFKRATELKFEKQRGQGFLEIAIEDNGAMLEPEFTLKQW